MMNQRRVVRLVLWVVAFMVVVPSWAWAQSSIGGLVTDASGGVLPGVMVEASSPALIEKARAVTTNTQGRYAIVNLRPGTYSVVFTLTGFSTFKRDGIEVLSNVNVPINAELKVGAIEETVTVSGQSPMVDVKAAGRIEVIDKTLLDELPTARSYSTAGAIIVGVKMNKPDMGGAATVQIAHLIGRGMPVTDGGRSNDANVDGMSVKLGGNQAYTNFAMAQEVSYQTSGGAAEHSAGGIRINMITRSGGNTFHGDVFWGGSTGGMSGNNVTPALKNRGLPATQAIDIFYDFNPAFGGPIIRNRAWFFTSWRRIILNNKTGGTYWSAQGDTPAGAPAIDDQWAQNGSLRITWQASPKNQIALYNDRNQKGRRHDMTDGQPAEVSPYGIDASSAAAARNPRLYYIGYGKWTSTVTSKLLFETGLSMVANNYKIIGQPGYEVPAGAPNYLTTVVRIDIIAGTVYGAPSFTPQTIDIINRNLQSNVTYVTGSHAFKTGFQWRSGFAQNQMDDVNGSLHQRFRSGVPDSVDVRSAPTFSRNELHANLDFYVQDSWTRGRFTINPGVRFEYLSASPAPSASGAGRFTPARQFDGVVPDLPAWFDVSPRFGLAYDVFGDAKTALKVSASKYMEQNQYDIAARYNPMGFQTDRRNWADCDYRPGTSTCSGIALPTNGDRIAQNNEIGPSNNRNFGVSVGRRPDPNLRRQYNQEYTASVQHQVTPAISVTGGLFRRTFYNIEGQYNAAINRETDYTAVQTVSPLSGETMTIFNLLPSKQGLVDIVDRNSDTNRRSYTGYEATFTVRLPNGGTALGGWSHERTVAVTCDTSDPNQLRFCDQTGQTHQDLGVNQPIPFVNEFKLAVAYPLPFKANVSMSMLSYPGLPLGVTWSVPASAFPNGQRTQAITTPLLSPGVNYLPRWNQMDISGGKTFQVGKVVVGGVFTVYNVLNSNADLGQTQTFGATLGRPTSILQARLLRLGITAKF